jgi:hypothetical protein
LAARSARTRSSSSTRRLIVRRLRDQLDRERGLEDGVSDTIGASKFNRDQLAGTEPQAAHGHVHSGF